MKYSFQKIITSAVICAIVGSANTSVYAQDSDSAIEEVLVTSERREVSLQEVPVAVTALSSLDLERKVITDVQDLQYAVPNISIAANTGTANGARIFLRGIGEDESRASAEPAVGVYVDGIFVGRAVGALFDLVDLERVEVLRGPQGTLYGRNSNGGAIRLISKKPQFDENTFDVGATLGSDGLFDAKLAGNIALSDRAAIRASFLNRTRDGFHTLNPNGDFASLAGTEVGELDTTAIRLSASYQFNDNWLGTFIFDDTQDDSDPVPDSINAEEDADGNLFTIEPATGSTCSAATPPNFLGIGCFTDYSSEVESRGYSFNLTGDIGDYTFQSLTAHRSLDDDLSSRISFPYLQQTEQDQISQELTLTSNLSGAFNYVTGLYFYDEDIQLSSVFVFPFELGIKTESKAFFFQSTYDFNDITTLTTGIRRTDETKDLVGQGPFGLGRTESRDFENTTFNLKVDRQFTDDVMGYASYATGFKSGGWSPDCFSGPACFLPVDEEELDTIEFGVRSTLMDNRLRLNATYFFNTYEGLQIGATVPGLGFTRFNVDESEINGLEVEAIFSATDSLTFNATLGTLDAEYTELSLDQAGGLTNNGASPGCNGVVSIECAKGLDLKNAPSFKGTLGFTNRTDLSTGSLTYGLDVSFEDESFNLVANNPNALLDVDSLWSGRIAYEPRNANWRVALWGKNLSDEEYGRASTGANFIYAADPLTWGLDFAYSFK